MTVPLSKYDMCKFTIYHNSSGESAYVPGHRLELAVSHWLELGSAQPADDIAGVAAEISLGADLLNVLEDYRDDSELGEIKFLMASLYALLGFRPLQEGDVVHVASGFGKKQQSTWLAMTREAWDVIAPPAGPSDAEFGAQTVARYASHLAPMAKEIRHHR